MRTIPGTLIVLMGALLALPAQVESAHAQSWQAVQLLGAPDPAFAARLEALRPAVPAQAPFAPGADTVAVRGPNYWAEGAAIGAVALGVPVAIVGFALCEEDCGSSVLLTSLGSAAAGAFIGAMIGGGIDKKPKEEAAPR